MEAKNHRYMQAMGYFTYKRGIEKVALVDYYMYMPRAQVALYKLGIFYVFQQITFYFLAMVVVFTP